MRRVMSVWFPQLPLDRWIRRADPRVDAAFAITRNIKNALRITHATKPAINAGVHIGQSLSDARAVCSELRTEISDAEREALLLRALWRWSDTLSPQVALDPPDGLYLDITGCAHLFGGEQIMGEHAFAQFSDQQIISRIAISDTKGASWALARFASTDIAIIPHGQTREGIKSLPLAALAIDPKTDISLRRTGLKTIGDLYGRKSSELARRFGLELTSRLSLALGHRPDPISPQAADPIYAARMTLPAPIGRLSDLNEVLSRLAGPVCSRLQKAQTGARRFELTVRCVDTGDHNLSIGFTRPNNQTGPLLQQYAKPLEKLKIEFGADWFRLVAKRLEPVKPRQKILGGEVSAKAEDFDQLMSTLGNRLGFDRVRRFIPQDYHVPELEFSTVEAATQNSGDWSRAHRPRPFRVFEKPERLRTLKAGRPPLAFEWRRQAYNTVSAIGPERLAPPWWLLRDLRQRDYWKTLTDSGQCLWLMTYPGGDPPEWFVAGRFV